MVQEIGEVISDLKQGKISIVRDSGRKRLINGGDDDEDNQSDVEQLTDLLDDADDTLGGG